MDTLDGSLNPDEQSRSIQFKEAGGFLLTSLAAGVANPATNNADFQDLPVTSGPPRPFHLVVGEPIPQGKVAVWSGNIYIEGVLKDAVGYRE